MKQALTLVPVQILNHYYTIRLTETVKETSHEILLPWTKCLNFLCDHRKDVYRLFKNNDKFLETSE